MKKITYKGIDYFYKIVCDDDGMGNDYKYTNIYSTSEIETHTYKKYWLWGKIITKTSPKFLFTLYFSIEDPTILKRKLTQVFEDNVQLLNRKYEIKNNRFFE